MACHRAAFEAFDHVTVPLQLHYVLHRWSFGYLQEGLPYASLLGRQNPRRSEAGSSKGDGADLAPLHSRDKRWYIRAW